MTGNVLGARCNQNASDTRERIRERFLRTASARLRAEGPRPLPIGRGASRLPESVRSHTATVYEYPRSCARLIAVMPAGTNTALRIKCPVSSA